MRTNSALVRNFLTIASLGAAMMGAQLQAAFTGGLEPQFWTVTGPGTTSITPASGPTNFANFDYSIDYGGGGAPFTTWVYQVTSDRTAQVTFDWSFTGFHSWFLASAQFNVFSNLTSGTVNTNLVSSGTFGGFGFNGTHTFDIEAGRTFGFSISGQNGDFDSRLLGTLSVSSFNAETPEPGTYALLGAGLTAIAVVRKRRTAVN